MTLAWRMWRRHSSISQLQGPPCPALCKQWPRRFSLDLHSPTRRRCCTMRPLHLASRHQRFLRELTAVWQAWRHSEGWDGSMCAPFAWISPNRTLLCIRQLARTRGPPLQRGPPPQPAPDDESCAVARLQRLILAAHLVQLLRSQSGSRRCPSFRARSAAPMRLASDLPPATASAKLRHCLRSAPHCHCCGQIWPFSSDAPCAWTQMVAVEYTMAACTQPAPQDFPSPPVEREMLQPSQSSTPSFLHCWPKTAQSHGSLSPWFGN
mmetsp:Transcript_8050/g.18017  ORF Transcript_8050/g.18017 Transcript_8050/m.18017 type:complete len:265 (+) Transcript_8050:2293-3087(+)